MGYSIEFDTNAVKDLARIQRNYQKRIATAIATLAADPRPNGCTKLSGTRDAYRIRIGDYRVIYTVNDAVRIINIDKIAHRREVYR